MKENRKLLKEVLKDIQHDMSDEEVLNLLADSKISVNPLAEKYTLGQRAADAIAKFAGSWAFIFSFTGLLILWMIVNTLLASKAFDPYPFILLNLVLSCVAAIQAPLIMMSQNRQEEKDRRRAENDYKVNGNHDRGHLRQGQRHPRQAVGAGKAAAKAERREKQIRFRHKFLMEHFKGSTADSIARCCLKSVIGATAPASAELVTYKHKTRQTLRPLSVSLRELLPFPIPEPRPQR